MPVPKSAERLDAVAKEEGAALGQLVRDYRRALETGDTTLLTATHERWLAEMPARYDALNREAQRYRRFNPLRLRRR